MTGRFRITPLVAAGAVALSAIAGAAAQDGPAITDVLESPLVGAEEREILVKHVDYPPGFSSPRHYHTGHLVVYVLEGIGAMEVDGKVRTATAGEVIEEHPEKSMVMRNESNSERLRFVVFQVGPEGAPFIVLQE